jgi:hypothetical protein
MLTYYYDRSAGLITHPEFVDDTKTYQYSYGLTNSPGINMLRFLPNFLGDIGMEFLSFDYI